jgi:hypothetical protein
MNNTYTHAQVHAHAQAYALAHSHIHTSTHLYPLEAVTLLPTYKHTHIYTNMYFLTYQAGRTALKGVQQGSRLKVPHLHARPASGYQVACKPSTE